MKMLNKIEKLIKDNAWLIYVTTLIVVLIIFDFPEFTSFQSFMLLLAIQLLFVSFTAREKRFREVPFLAAMPTCAGILWLQHNLPYLAGFILSALVITGLTVKLYENRELCESYFHRLQTPKSQREKLSEPLREIPETPSEKVLHLDS